MRFSVTVAFMLVPECGEYFLEDAFIPIDIRDTKSR